MQTLQLKATLVGTTPTVWRTLAFHPETGLEQVHDMLLIVMGWDDENAPVFVTNDGPITPEDDAYHEASLNEYLAKAGDTLSYSLDTEEEFLVELELTALTDESEDAQLPRVVAGAHQAPPVNGGEAAASEALPTSEFNAKELNEEARELFDDEGGADLGFAGTDEPDDTDGLEDADATAGEIAFQPEWLAAEHGIKVSEANVRNVPQDIINFRAQLTEDDLETPRKYLRKIRPLFEKHPNDALLNFEMAGLYGMTGEGKKSRQLMRRVNKEFSDNLDVLIHRALSMDDEDDFIKSIAKLPRPLDIRNHPAGKDGYYHVTELLGFEELAIRDAVITGDLEAARQRLDRLVNFGFLHGDVEQSAVAIAGMMVINMETRIQDGELPAHATLTDAFAPLTKRTNAILEVSVEEVGEMMREYEESLTPIRREGPKVGRNDPCPCGSGKKFKKCCK